MNDDVKHLIEQLREPVWGEPVRVVNDRLRTAALFLESLAAELEITEAVAAQARGLECERDLLAAELEHVKQERDGLNILLGQAQSMLETRTRERDAAVEDLRKVVQAVSVCFCCKSRDEEYVSNDCMDCINSCNWQWRGVPV